MKSTPISPEAISESTNHKHWTNLIHLWTISCSYITKNHPNGIEMEEDEDIIAINKHLY